MENNNLKINILLIRNNENNNNKINNYLDLNKDDGIKRKELLNIKKIMKHNNLKSNEI